MFTGLIESLGQVLNVDRKGQEGRFKIKPQRVWSDLQFGESIAINGACLSVEDISGNDFIVYASQETLSKTNLIGLQRGDKVNLERSLTVGARLGGHFVSGHIDCLARVHKFKHVGQSLIVGLDFPEQWSVYIVAKGSIALDGVSLTINACQSGYLEVNVIPATWNETIIYKWNIGTYVNMETDLIAKYVSQMLGSWAGRENIETEEDKRGLSEEFLREQGFI